MDALKFPFAVELPVVHGDPGLVRFLLHLFPGGVQHGGGTEVDDLPHLGFIQGADEIPDFRINAEGIIGVAKEQDICLFGDGAADWERLSADKRLGYVYFEIPCPACDTALLRENVLQARARGLKTGMCFTFTDSLLNVNEILGHLLSVPMDLSEVSPMISVPQERSFERSIIHRRIQIWANVLKKNYGEQPILKASRENCKDYLAPVLTSTYRICLVFTDPSGSYMLQHPNPNSTPDTDLTAYPCRVTAE